MLWLLYCYDVMNYKEYLLALSVKFYLEAKRVMGIFVIKRIYKWGAGFAVLRKPGGIKTRLLTLQLCIRPLLAGSVLIAEVG